MKINCRTVDGSFLICKSRVNRGCKSRPIDAIDNLPLGDREDPDPFSQAEIQTILSTPTQRIQEIHMMGFAFWIGMRISELIALAWEDIDQAKWTMKVRRANVKGRYMQTKTKRSTREVELIAPAIRWLKAQRVFSELLQTQSIEVTSRDNKKSVSEAVRFVFLNSRSQLPHHSDNAVRDRFWRTHLKRAKVRYRGPNMARHTFISQLLTAGIAKEWIMRQVGHSSTKMIDDHYGKWLSEEASGMADIVSKKLVIADTFVRPEARLVLPRSHSKSKNPIYLIKSKGYVAEREGFEP